MGYKSIKDTIEQELAKAVKPITSSQLQVRLQMNHSGTIRKWLIELADCGKAHIADWYKVSHAWAPAWLYGAGEHAPAPIGATKPKLAQEIPDELPRQRPYKTNLQVPDVPYKTTFVGGINPWSGQ